MKFQRIYIEITNICGLSCSFCPSKQQNNQVMDLEFYKNIILQIKLYTKEIALHIVGDAMTLSNLQKYLQIAHDNDLKVIITTSGFHMKNREVLFHRAIKQVNFSLNSFDKNETNLSFDDYMDKILDFCDKKLSNSHESFTNLRLWNQNSHEDMIYNQKVYTKLENHFNTKIETSNKTFRLAKKILLHFDDYFIWPNLNSNHKSDGYCNGLITHFGILNDGRVVPCCLDFTGVITLGDLKIQTLADILATKRVKDIRNGFKNKISHESLCQKCEYKMRFYTHKKEEK